MGEIRRSILKKAFRYTIPVMFGYVPIGIAFGLLLTKSGYPWFFAVLMSIVVYSGANQFLAVGFFIKNALFVTIRCA
ncbi:MAG TPA: AzlC family ABC transporter permease [Syntrophorhabdaceae bacterium]|nr:AzlC family ABC transporter permease [Syntrophorhabdaceae bacterium]